MKLENVLKVLGLLILCFSFTGCPEIKFTDKDLQKILQNTISEGLIGPGNLALKILKTVATEDFKGFQNCFISSQNRSSSTGDIGKNYLELKNLLSNNHPNIFLSKVSFKDGRAILLIAVGKESSIEIEAVRIAGKEDHPAALEKADFTLDPGIDFSDLDKADKVLKDSKDYEKQNEISEWKAIQLKIK